MLDEEEEEKNCMEMKTEKYFNEKNLEKIYRRTENCNWLIIGEGVLLCIDVYTIYIHTVVS